MNRRRIVRKSLLGLVLTVGLFSPPAVAAPLRFAAADQPPGQATLEIQADKLVTMAALPFRLLLKDAAGKPLTGARVSCDLIMPSMRMPENRPKIVERDGAYVGEMILTCTMGDWRAACIAENGQGLHQKMTFDIGTARMQ